MAKVFQRILLVIGVIGLVVLLTEIGLSIAATTHGSTPARVVHAAAGPYQLTVSLYTYPANAGFALPFAIAPAQPGQGTLTYDVTSVPRTRVSATPVHASVSPDPQVPGGIQGTAEITVQGTWLLHVVVTGPAGPAVTDVPIEATAPPAIPQWLGWLIGSIPFWGLLIFLLLQRGRKKAPVQKQENVMVTQ